MKNATLGDTNATLGGVTRTEAATVKPEKSPDSDPRGPSKSFYSFREEYQ